MEHQENLQHAVLGITSIFKTPYKISGVDRYTIHNAFRSLVTKLPGFFSKVVVGQPSDVNAYDLPIIGTPKYHPNYLLVLSELPKVLGTQCYCKLILEDGDIVPKQKIILIGPRYEVGLFITAARYLHVMSLGVFNATKHQRGLKTPKQYKADLLQKIYNDTYLLLKGLGPIRKLYMPEDSQNIRDAKVLHFIKNNVKLEYKKNKNPKYSEAPFTLEDARTKMGTFRNNKLL